MAIGEKSRIDNGTSENSFQADEIACFLKSKELGSISLILLDMAIPFKRSLSAVLSVTEPLFSLIFGQENAEKAVSFALEENSLEALRTALERGKK